MTIFWRRLLHLLPGIRKHEERELDAELQAIAELAAAEGEDARRALGNLALAKEDARSVSRWAWLENTAADIRYSFRVLRRDRAFTFVTLVTLALCIGANAAIFTLVDAVLIKSLPVVEPERLVEFRRGSSAYLAWKQYQEQSTRWMAGMLATTGVGPRDLDTGGGAFRGSVELVTGNYFEVLGLRAARGRLLTPEDDGRGSPAFVAVLSDRFWRRHFDAREDVLGRSVRVQGASLTVVGVAPREFFGVAVGDAADLWVPLSLHPTLYPNRRWLDEPNTNFLWILGRLRDGVTMSAAADALTPVMQNIDLMRAGSAAKPSFVERVRKERLRLTPASYGVSALRARFSRPLWVLFWLVGIALLLGCVNLLNLQLARTTERRPEIAVRLALGARRGRILRQLLIESLMLAAAAAAFAIVVSRPAAQALAGFLTQGGQSLVLQTDINAPLLWYVAVLAMGATVITGLIPAVRATDSALLPAMQSGGRSITPHRSHHWMARSLLSVQVALSLFLVAGASLFGLTLYKLLEFDLGLDRSHLAMLEVDPKEAGYDDFRTKALVLSLRDRIRAVPGVISTTYSQNGVFAGRNASNVVHVDGFTHSGDNESQGWFDTVGPGYFSVVRATLVAGRDFTDADHASAPRVTIISEAFARHFFGERTPIGRNVYVGQAKTPWQVVGVVRDMRVEGVRQQPRRWIYLPALQTDQPLWSVRMLVRTAGPPENLFGSFRRVVRQENSRLPIVGMDTASDLLNRTMDRDRLLAHLTAAFGILSLLIAAVGVYGLLSYEVAKRTHEVGIRIAMGAKRSSILQMVLSETVILCLAGIVAGTAAALACGHFVQSLLFGLEPNSPTVLGTAAVTLLSVAVGAAAIPAFRAASADPMAALRHE